MACRLCSDCDNLIDIFGRDFQEIEGLDLDVCIEIATGIKIMPQDNKSIQICKVCFTAVEEYMAFRSNCYRSSMEQIVQAADTIQVDTPPAVADNNSSKGGVGDKRQ